MTYTGNIFSATLAIPSLFAIIIGLMLLYRTQKDSINYLSLIMFSTAWWAICYAINLTATTQAEILGWVKLEYFGIAFIPPLWVFFCLQFTKIEHKWSLAPRMALLIIPCAVIASVWTLEFHDWYYQNMHLTKAGSLFLLKFTAGPLYIFCTIYFYICLMYGILLIASRYKYSNQIYKSQATLIIISASVPWIANIIYLSGFRPFGVIDVTPYAFLFTAISIGIGLLKFKLFSLIPQAREKLIESMSEGFMVLEKSYRIVDINHSMRQILGNTLPSYNGAKLHNALVGAEQILSELPKGLPFMTKFRMTTIHSTEYYHVLASPLKDEQFKLNGYILLFRNITEKLKDEKKLMSQNETLKDIAHLQSHEIRRPVANILGLIEVLKLSERSGLSQEQIEYLRLLEKEAKSLDFLVRQIVKKAEIVEN